MTTPDPYGAIVTPVDRAPLPGPLDGLRVGIKDVIAVQGVPRLCGAPHAVDGSPQPRDATAVARLVAAGAHVVATTATHEFAWGVRTPGTTNPRAPDRLPGGSSGGSAAALAGGLVDGALGTDTAGSVRIPAACCGVVGLKTTEGVVPRDGVQPLAPTLDTVGPMARDVATVAALQSALTATTVVPVVPSPLRVGVVQEVETQRLDTEIRAAWQDALAALREAGARVSKVSLPLLERARTATMTVLASEEHAVHQSTVRDFSAALSPRALQALAAGGALSNEEVLAARRDLAVFRDSLGGGFASVDVLVLPVLPCRVPALDEETVHVEGGTERVGAALTRLTSPYSGAGVPAGSVPTATDPGGGPIAMQIVGAWRNEAAVLGVMALVEELAGGPWPPVDASPSRVRA